MCHCEVWISKEWHVAETTKKEGLNQKRVSLMTHAGLAETPSTDA